MWSARSEEAGLDSTKRFLHVTAEALVMEVEGVDEVSDEAKGVIGAYFSRFPIRELKL